MLPKVSIITVVYNNREFINDAILSVLSQNYPNMEYIVVDGASTDGTVDIVRRYAGKIEHILSEPDQGIYDAMNKGIALSSGDIIGMLNSDDLYADENVVATVVRTMAGEGSDACYGDLVYVDRADTGRIVRRWKSCPYSEELLPNGWIPPHPTFFVRKWVYEKYGVFDLSFPIAADYEIMFRFLQKYRVRSSYIPKLLVKMRLGGLTNRHVVNIVKQNLEIARTLRNNGFKVRPGFVYHKLLNRIGQFIFRHVS